jgi:hypothetical protein
MVARLSLIGIVMSNEKVIELALGRIFRMGARPTQPGDVEEYERCRAIIMEASGPVVDDAPKHIRREGGRR